MTTTRETEYLSCAETAKLVRAALKRAFPTTKFSVRSDVYSGGASIDIGWTDGPRRERVEEIAKRFEGADFDGMIDLKTSRQHYLTDAGDVTLAHATGTEGSRGVIPGYDNPTPPPAARRVHFGADFIFCQRRLSNEADRTAQAIEIIRDRCVTTGTPPHDQFGNQWVEDLARRMVSALHFPEMGLSTLNDTFREVVHQEPGVGLYSTIAVET